MKAEPSGRGGTARLPGSAGALFDQGFGDLFSVRVAGNIVSTEILGSILPGLTAVDPVLPPDAQLRAAVEANVRWSMHQLAETSEGRRALAERQAMLIGAVYELSTGHVRFLDV